ncbi:MAG: hypothetical protein F6K11_27715, partial [Leptolyngbya sp. SIO3F4]|nr:hypothetical protein [Leptolyngbya sp. SIO3F4]
KERLDEQEETLILFVRTYLQRVTSKLSAAEFIDMLQTAITLLGQESLVSKLSLPEARRLLYIALQTFGKQLSQPIPPLGEQIPERIAKLIVRLVRYQKIMRTSGMQKTLATLVTQTIAQQLSPETLRTVLKNSKITITPELDTQEGLEDLARALFFKVQLQTTSSITTKSKQDIADQLSQAIIDFKTKYQPLADITQPKWGDELSISSPFFTPSNFETASNDFAWLSSNFEEKNSKDDTNS